MVVGEFVIYFFDRKVELGGLFPPFFETPLPFVLYSWPIAYHVLDFWINLDFKADYFFFLLFLFFFLNFEVLWTLELDG